MRLSKKESGKTINKTAKQKVKPEFEEPAAGKMEEVQRLVHLLQVHQIELEHQNQELRIAHAELEVSRNRYVNLFDFSPIPYFTLDKEGVIQEVNLSAGKMFGIERNKLIGKRLISFIPLNERDIYNSFIESVFNSAVKQSCELKVLDKDKRVFRVLLEGLQVIDTLESDQKCQIALIDLTEYKRVEDSYKKSTEELKILNATKDKLFSIIAHDLRNPFQALLSSAELLAMKIDRLSHEEIVLFSSSLNSNLIKLFGLLENLLNWSLMQRNIIEFKPVSLNLCNIVDKIIEILSQSAMKKNISISNKVEPGTVVYADADMLHSVVQNLIINAIKFTKAEGQIIITCNERSDFVEVSVRDTGMGIEPERISKLFDLNALATSSGTAGEKGTGLGLPLCKEFIEKHGGKIWVDSKPGQGSKFAFTLHKTA